RFTLRAWNLTTHRIDPDVDEARDYVLEDLLAAVRVPAAGYVGGGDRHERASSGRNRTCDSYCIDGRRVVILLADTRRGP
ncbi:MAG: LssY C-terminal domain-containing protein, partial [Planctomycetia bacterium]